MTKNLPPIELLWLGLYAFAGFSLELIIYLCLNLFGLQQIGKNAQLILVGISWLLFSLLLLHHAKKEKILP